jgi:hypothetical protein
MAAAAAAAVAEQHQLEGALGTTTDCPTLLVLFENVLRGWCCLVTTTITMVMVNLPLLVMMVVRR